MSLLMQKLIKLNRFSKSQTILVKKKKCKFYNFSQVFRRTKLKTNKLFFFKRLKKKKLINNRNSRKSGFWYYKKNSIFERICRKGFGILSFKIERILNYFLKTTIYLNLCAVFGGKS
jgi:hypothetical protein